MGDCIRRVLPQTNGAIAYTALDEIIRQVRRSHGDPTYVVVSDAVWSYVRNKFSTQQRFTSISLLAVFDHSHQAVQGLRLDRSVLLCLDRDDENPNEPIMEFWYGYLPDEYQGKLLGPSVV